LTAAIKDDANQILRETAAFHQQMLLMKLQIDQMRKQNPADNVVLQSFFEETTSYDESVVEDPEIASILKDPPDIDHQERIKSTSTIFGS
jgi:hypothetical protein